MKLERRYLPAEVRAAGDGNRKIAGYVTKFDALSQVIYDFRERFAVGCFDACLAENPDILGLYNHSMDNVLARTSSGTMRVHVDETGLAYEMDPAPTTLGKDLLILLERGDVRGSSIGFYCLEDAWDLGPDGMLIRTIVRAAVFDISVVTDPAYLTSDASLRSQLPQNDAALEQRAKDELLKLQQQAQSDTNVMSLESLLALTELAELDIF